MFGYHDNSIFWVETAKIQPNPFQPRREFDRASLEDLADSIRQYGVLQPLVVTRKEILRPENNGMDVLYELIAGERRLRAATLAGLQQVPVIIRKETDDKVKLELAIIENLQREDLNPIDRALAFQQLYKEFKLTHVEIGRRMGKSRVYVSNTLRLLSLPDDIKKGLMDGRITEGHTRPLLMLSDRPEEQVTLYKEIMVKKMSVRDAEKIARKIAQDRVRKKEFVVDPKIREFEKKLAENLGTRVHIEPREKGGKITIDYFTVKDLEAILSSIQKVEREQSMMDSYLKENKEKETIKNSTPFVVAEREKGESNDISRKISDSEKIIVHRDELPEYRHNEQSEIVPAIKEIEAPHNVPASPVHGGSSFHHEKKVHENDLQNSIQEETRLSSRVVTENTSVHHETQNQRCDEGIGYRQQNVSREDSYQQFQDQRQIHSQPQPVRKKSILDRFFR